MTETRHYRYYPLELLRKGDPKEYGQNPCIACGKETDGTRMVHLGTWGSLVRADEKLDENEDQGWFPIGPDCAKKLPTGFVVVWT